MTEQSVGLIHPELHICVRGANASLRSAPSGCEYLPAMRPVVQY
jgi:hypothetical protein